MVMRVLFVDDDQEVVQLLGTIAGMVGLEHDVTCSAQDALGLCEHQEYSLVITDLKMAEMDGVDLAKALKERYPTMGLFAFTGESSSYVADELKSLFEGVYMKPSDYSRVLADAMRFLAVRRYPFLR